MTCLHVCRASGDRGRTFITRPGDAARKAKQTCSRQLHSPFRQDCRTRSSPMLIGKKSVGSSVLKGTNCSALVVPFPAGGRFVWVVMVVIGLGARRDRQRTLAKPSKPASKGGCQRGGIQEAADSTRGADHPCSKSMACPHLCWSRQTQCRCLICLTGSCPCFPWIAKRSAHLADKLAVQLGQHLRPRIQRLEFTADAREPWTSPEVVALVGQQRAEVGRARRQRGRRPRAGRRAGRARWRGRWRQGRCDEQ
jgi:hypothetical protein